jgi:acetyl-CoA carboxylase carboxyl transferase subunit alpha
MFLEFEKSVLDLESKIEELKHLAHREDLDIAGEIQKIQQKIDKSLKQIYKELTPWQKVQIARHPNRPQSLDYIQTLFDCFTPLAGDRLFAEDASIVGGMGLFNNRPVMVIGHQKGTDMDSRLKHNFGMPKPEGYRKARRLIDLASDYNLPIITFIDTAGAYPGIDAEERGQAEAIARSIQSCLSAHVPIISFVIGEGGSGGAIAIATSNYVYMLEHSIYSIISPEGCASILWRNGAKASDAADSLKLTAQDLLKLKVIDGIIEEPLGGAHRQKKQTIEKVKDFLESVFVNLPIGVDWKAKRSDRFLSIK